MNHSKILELTNVTKTFHSRFNSSTNSDYLTVLDNVNLTLNHGELLGLLGPSGCGKTTLLRVVAGFEAISQGQVFIAGKVICTNCESLAAEKRNTGMVFQDYALFPHLTVAENIAFGLKNLKEHKGFFPSRKANLSVRQRVNEVLELVGLPDLAQRYPHQLSGGQQQRISLARALAPQPALILLDEPLSNLDVQVRHRLRAEIRAIIKAAGTSAIFVTHDREEALAISDKIAVMRQGKIEQVDSPENVYLNPASRFVAEFVTQANLLPATRQGQAWHTQIGNIVVPQADLKEQLDSDAGDLMLRPEEINLTLNPQSPIVVRSRQFLGREYFYTLEAASGKIITARTSLDKAIAIGAKVALEPDLSNPQIFPAKPETESSLVPLPQ